MLAKITNKSNNLIVFKNYLCWLISGHRRYAAGGKQTIYIIQISFFLRGNKARNVLKKITNVKFPNSALACMKFYFLTLPHLFM